MDLQVLIWKEEDTFLIRDVVSGVTTQGNTIETAMRNIVEAVGLYTEELFKYS